MNNINKIGKYGVGFIVYLYILWIILGDIVVLGFIHSSLAKYVFIFLFFVPIGTAYKGYRHSLQVAQQQDTKSGAWKTLIFGTIFSILLSYAIGYFLGYIAGVFFK